MSSPPKDLMEEPPADVLTQDSGMPVDEPSAMESAFKTVDDLVRSLASGMTFGYADEIAAAAETATGDKSYSENLAAQQARDKTIPPYVSIPGEITGAVGTAVAGGPVMAGGKALAGLPGWLRATTLGGGYGALFGSGHAEQGQRLKGAALGGGAGAATGLAAYPIIQGAQWGVNQLAEAIRGRARPRVGALRKLGEAITRDEMTPSRVRARLQNLGPQGTLTDAGGENVLSLGRAVSGSPGVARNRAITTFNQRAAGEGDRIAKIVSSRLSPDDFYAAEEGFVKALRTKAAPLYQEAYQQNQSIMTPPLKRLLQSRHTQRALRETVTIVEAERASGASKYLGAIDDELTQAARFAREVGKMDRRNVPREGLAKGFSLETWDQIKRGFDSLLESKTYRNEITQRLNQKGRAVNEMRVRLLKELDKATGGEKSIYAQARKIYAGDAEVVSTRS